MLRFILLSGFTMGIASAAAMGFAGSVAADAAAGPGPDRPATSDLEIPVPLFERNRASGAASQVAAGPLGFAQQSAKGSTICYLVTCVDQGFVPEGADPERPQASQQMVHPLGVSQQNPYGSSMCLTALCTQRAHGSDGTVSQQVVAPGIALQQNVKGSSVCVVGVCTGRPGAKPTGKDVRVPSQTAAGLLGAASQNGDGATYCLGPICKHTPYGGESTVPKKGR